MIKNEPMHFGTLTSEEMFNLKTFLALATTVDIFTFNIHFPDGSIESRVVLTPRDKNNDPDELIAPMHLIRKNKL